MYVIFIIYVDNTIDNCGDDDDDDDDDNQMFIASFTRGHTFIRLPLTSHLSSPSHHFLYIQRINNHLVQVVCTILII